MIFQIVSILSDGKTMVVGTDRGEVLYFNENCEFKLVLSPLQNQNQQSIDGFPIECIVKYSNGFIVGGSDGMIYIQQKRLVLYRYFKNFLSQLYHFIQAFRKILRLRSSIALIIYLS